METETLKDMIMKFILLLLMLHMTNTVWGACSSITRTNASPNSVLTSTKYNADLNTVYSFANSYDGECIQADSIPLSALQSSTTAGLTNSAKLGCKVTRSDAATLSVSECSLGVNGSLVETATNTTVTWGCTSCASEAASTSYYLYAKDGSTGTTLDLLIATETPQPNGTDSSDNVALARFFNNGSQDIITDRIAQWTGQKFDDLHTFAISISNNGTAAIVSQGPVDFVSSVNRDSAGRVTVTFVESFFTLMPSMAGTAFFNAQDAGESLAYNSYNADRVIITIEDLNVGAEVDTDFNLIFSRSGSDAW